MARLGDQALASGAQNAVHLADRLLLLWQDCEKPCCKHDVEAFAWVRKVKHVIPCEPAVVDLQAARLSFCPVELTLRPIDPGDGDLGISHRQLA